MPLTIKHINKDGKFEIRDSANVFIGNGRAKPSKQVPGMVTLFFPQAAVAQMGAGLRVPINWTNEELYTDD